MTSKPATFVRALVLLIVVAVGVPWLLTWAADRRFGGPAPWSAMPPPADWSAGTIRDALTDRLSEATIADIVIRVGLAVVWAAVIVLLVTVVAEMVHMVRHGGLSLPDVRGLGSSQRLARTIAAGLLVVVPMLTPTKAVADDSPLLRTEDRAVAAEHVARPDNAWVDDRATPPPVAPVEASPTDPFVTTRTTGAVSPGTYVVRPGDSVYGIAERFAGPELRDVSAFADQILELNLGRQMVDGQRFTNAAYIDIGWVFELPGGTTETAPATAAAETHVVEEGETLWSIADDELGDAERWPEVYEENEGRIFDDGRSLTDPDMIQPGWELRLPEADDAPVGASDPPDTDVDAATDESPAIDPPTIDTAAPVVADASLVDAADDGPARADNAWVDDDPAPPTVSEDDRVTPADQADGPDVPSASPDATHASSVPAPAVVGEAPHADPGEAPDVQLLTLERAAMLSTGFLTLLAVRRRSRMRRARVGSQLPDPSPVATRTERALRSFDAGDRFARVDIAIRAASMALVERGARPRAVAIAPDGDLELWSDAPARLAGPWEQGVDATRWLLPGGTPIEMLAPEARRVGAPTPTLVQLGICVDGRDLYVDLEALEAIEVGGPGDQADAIVTAVASTLASSVLAEVTTLVGVGVDDRAFFGHRLHRPVRDTASAFAAAADAVGSTALAERSTFELRARVTSGEAWEPAVVLAGSSLGTVTPPANRRGLAVVSASPIIGPSSRLAPDGDAWQLLPLGLRLRPIGLEPGAVAALSSLAEVPEPEPVPEPMTPALDDDRTMAPSEWLDGPGRELVDAAAVEEPRPEPSLREHRLVVRLLGPVAVESADGAPVEFERSKTKELIAWLATHRERSTRSNARAALWELDVRDATFSNVVSEARRAMARCVEPPEGEEWVGRTLTDDLPLHELVVTDVDLVRDAIEAARLQPPALAIETLRGALDRVAGVPFEGTAYLWADAEGITSDCVLRAITLTTSLAEHCLSVGDIEGVFAATGRGLQVLPAHEGMIAARMRAYATVGDRSGVSHEWETYERAITADPWSDGEPSPEMLDLRRELM